MRMATFDWLQPEIHELILKQNAIRALKLDVRTVVSGLTEP
jgi:hypothetical protein